MFLRKRLILAVLATLGVGSVALAQPRDEFNALSARTPWKVVDGVETREFKLTGGINVEQQRVNGKTSTMMMDVSGHGAVRCALQTFITFVIVNDVCRVNDTKWRSVLMSAVGRIGEFAERNAIEPVKKGEIVARAEDSIKQAAVNTSAEEIKQACTEPRGFVEAYSILREMGEAKFVAQVDDLLSVERPAVLNPCY
jgi:hypothetical protein